MDLKEKIWKSSLDLPQKIKLVARVDLMNEDQKAHLFRLLDYPEALFKQTELETKSLSHKAYNRFFKQLEQND